MHLLWRSKDGVISRKEFDKDPPAYAVLSHRWQDDEPNFQDITNGTAWKKAGYDKLDFCGKQAEKDGIKYFWVDTVCIDRTSSAALGEAIISMFRWYHKSAKCYVYLRDVKSAVDLPRSDWFTRGWTLQELIAPRKVEFFSFKRNRLGDKVSLESIIKAVTGIPIEALRGQRLSTFSVAERMSWVENRVTTLPEDSAYCLMGIFDVCMPVLYGERKKKAFSRLNSEIEKERASEDPPRTSRVQNVPQSPSNMAPTASYPSNGSVIRPSGSCSSPPLSSTERVGYTTGPPVPIGRYSRADHLTESPPKMAPAASYPSTGLDRRPSGYSPVDTTLRFPLSSGTFQYNPSKGHYQVA